MEFSAGREEKVWLEIRKGEAVGSSRADEKTPGRVEQRPDD